MVNRKKGKISNKGMIQILEGNKEKLHELTKYLVERETITGEEFMEILNKENKSEEK
ncbi:MAG: hypothetical protein WAM95_21075 [Bacillus sp. (in: firmicutes)]